DEVVQRDLINLIETIIVFKLPQKSREEIAAMLGLSELKNTRFYQEVFEEGKQEGKQEAKLETVLALLQLGLTSAQIAEALKLPLELVQQTAQQTTRQAMSFSEQNVAAFIELLTHQRSLFTPEDLAELEQVVDPLPNDITEISKALSSWYKKHPQIREAQLQLLPNPNDSGDKAPGSKEGNVKTPNYELNKQTLKNAIQQSSSSQDSQSSNSGS
ncbi:MAG: DUF2887 domain-containing protein, partial [Coleofasciculus sp. C2-GNP5-27]